MESNESGEGEGKIEFAEVVLKGGAVGVKARAVEDSVVDRVLDWTEVAVVVVVMLLDEGGAVGGAVSDPEPLEHSLEVAGETGVGFLGGGGVDVWMDVVEVNDVG